MPPVVSQTGETVRRHDARRGFPGESCCGPPVRHRQDGRPSRPRSVLLCRNLLYTLCTLTAVRYRPTELPIAGVPFFAHLHALTRVGVHIRWGIGSGGIDVRQPETGRLLPDRQSTPRSCCTLSPQQRCKLEMAGMARTTHSHSRPCCHSVQSTWAGHGTGRLLADPVVEAAIPRNVAMIISFVSP